MKKVKGGTILVGIVVIVLLSSCAGTDTQTKEKYFRKGYTAGYKFGLDSSNILDAKFFTLESKEEKINHVIKIFELNYQNELLKAQ